ncbi:MAG: restriction endonuclease subunit S [Gammaproteobacteria bacterium]|nr:restriction endonuclease subunit S [Gammaproteobacteria bacterium]
MSDDAWPINQISQIALAIKDGSHGTHKRVVNGVPLLSAKNVTDQGLLKWDDTDDQISEADYVVITTSFNPLKDDILLTIVGTLGRRALFNGSKVAFQRSVAFIRLDQSQAKPRYLFHAVASPIFLRQLIQRSNATAQAGLYLGELAKTTITLPPLAEQSRIAAILDTVDEAIAKTEAVIAKLKQVRAGLLHDLLTRGLDENGQLRDPLAHPEQFQDSPMGRIPKIWKFELLSEMVASAVDGPFGSNLKTEHYVSQAGVRVVRLQNIENGRFDDVDKAFISEQHAFSLRRHEVVAGDLLVASMGDENHPVARACLYPAHISPGIVKADCFRLRMKLAIAINGFVMLFLNCPSTRREVNVLGQGVTRDRINLSTLLKLRVLRPPVEEQKQVVEAVDALDIQIQNEISLHTKLVFVKSALMTDLLTGRVRVPADLDFG